MAEKSRRYFRVNASILIKTRKVDVLQESDYPEPDIFLSNDSRYAEIMSNGIGMINLSQNGLRFDNPTKYKSGENVEITLLFPKHRELWYATQVYGKVIWNKPTDGLTYKVGIKFTGMSEGARLAIAGYVNQRRAEEIDTKRHEERYNSLSA